jgi:hypothetical protein
MRFSPPRRALLLKACLELEQQGITRRSTSPVVSPAFLVFKESAEARKVIDYSELNRCTERLNFPMPLIADVIAKLQGARFFCRFDLRRGFWQVSMHPDSIYLTAFITPDGVWEYNRGPMGTMNLPQFFSSEITLIFFDMFSFLCVFIDDVFIFAQTLEELFERTRQFLLRSRERRLRWNPDKCVMGATEIECLGLIANGQGIRASPRRKQGILSIAEPKNIRALRSFLGAANVMRSFIRDYSRKIKPLTELTGKEQLRWSPDAQQAFSEIKQDIVNAPMLMHVDPSLPLITRSDGSYEGVGGVLLQRKDNQEMVISYVSRAFNEVERRWATIEQEAYALFFVIMKHDHYLQGTEFIAEVDHANLLFLQVCQAPKVVRWKIALQGFSFVVHHIPGKLNVLPDMLSRCHRVDVSDSPWGGLVNAPNRFDALARAIVVEEPQSEADGGSEEEDRPDDSHPPPAPASHDLPALPHRELIERVHNAVIGHRGRDISVRLLR